jgi:hypothetical protein
MKLPFTTSEFLNVFKEYNEAVWPLQVIFYALAVFTFLSVIRKGFYANMIAFSFLGFLWIWMGVVYHLIFFSAINKTANLFATLFIAQGLIFLFFNSNKQKIKLELSRDGAGILGVIFIVYALMAYPLLGLLLGHAYPAAPIFGAPCPTAIFTFGILLFSNERIPWYVVIIPFLWSLVSFSAAVNLSILQDIGLVIAGVVSTLIVVFFKPKRSFQTGMAV